MNSRRIAFPVLLGLVFFLLGVLADRHAAGDDDDDTPIVELRGGDRLEVKIDGRGRVNLVRTRSSGEERFIVRKGEGMVFEVSSGPPAEEEAHVERVLDGDTLVITLRGREERVRLLGVDTPEIFGDYYSVEAWEETRRLCEGKDVRLVYDERRTGDLGRILAYVYAGDVCVNRELIAGGFARMPERTDTLLIAKYDEFAALQAAAQKDGKGVWNGADAKRWETLFVPEKRYTASRATFHRPACPHAQGLLEPTTFDSIESSLAARRHPCSKCLPARNYEPGHEERDD